MLISALLYTYVLCVCLPLCSSLSCPIYLDCRIHRLHLCRGVRPPNDCPVYDT